MNDKAVSAVTPVILLHPSDDVFRFAQAIRSDLVTLLREI